MILQLMNFMMHQRIHSHSTYKRMNNMMQQTHPQPLKHTNWWIIWYTNASTATPHTNWCTMASVTATQTINIWNWVIMDIDMDIIIQLNLNSNDNNNDCCIMLFCFCILCFVLMLLVLWLFIYFHLYFNKWLIVLFLLFQPINKWYLKTNCINITFVSKLSLTKTTNWFIIRIYLIVYMPSQLSLILSGQP